MMQHRYPQSALIADYLRAGTGLVLTAGPLLIAEPLPVISGVLAALAVLFAVYGVRTVLRHGAAVELSDEGIRTTGPLGSAVAWSELRHVRLRYFSTRRDRRNGWMQLVVAGQGRAVRLDSSLQGFEEVSRRVAREAEDREIGFNAPTAANFSAMGIPVSAEQAR